MAMEVSVAVRVMSMTGAALEVALVLSGCVLSVDPVVPESDARFDPRLLGTWEEVGGSDRAVVSRAAENMFAIEYTVTEGWSSSRHGSASGDGSWSVDLGDGRFLAFWSLTRTPDAPA